MSSTIESQRTSDFTYYLLKRMTLLYIICSKFIANDRVWYMFFFLFLRLATTHNQNHRSRPFVDEYIEKNWQSRQTLAWHYKMSTISMIILCICIFSGVHFNANTITFSPFLCSCHSVCSISLFFYSDHNIAAK